MWAIAEPLVFERGPMPPTGRYTRRMDPDPTDSGQVRAGYAFAGRRQEMGITQRELARKKIITASSLIAFEKGRAWPRERTRAMLEELAHWPPGTLAAIRSGGPIPGARPSARSESPDAPLIVEAVHVALTTVDVAIAGLPSDEHGKFGDHVVAVLADLRRLETITARAVRSSQAAPEVFRMLGEVRQRYDELMLRAARGRDATLGQRLYAARRAAWLTPPEAALALGAPTELVHAAESEAVLPEGSAERIEALITDLTVRGDGASAAGGQPEVR